MDFYRIFVRPILLSGVPTDPEWLHQQTINFLRWLDRSPTSPVARWVQSQLEQSCSVVDSRLTQTLWGLEFKNPLGLAAGFDKNGDAAGIWASFGFGFAELGTCTFHPQPGNPRPRMFRLPKDYGALNRMGFNNRGSAAMATELAQRWPEVARPIPIGINIGKSKITPLAEAAQDYLASFKLLQPWGDYFVVNVSSPNTPGLRSLQDGAMLSAILEVLQAENRTNKPIFVKISPDLEWEAIGDVIKVAMTYQLAGIIATNTTIRRDGLKTQIISATGNLITEEAGGISGTPLKQRSTEIIRFIWQQTQGQIPIIGTGGVFTAEDAWEKITAGASLLEIYTGLIYEGPLIVHQILQGLTKKLEESGLSKISEAVGWKN